MITVYGVDGKVVRLSNRDHALRCYPGSRQAKKWMFRAWRAGEITFGEFVRYCLIHWRG